MVYFRDTEIVFGWTWDCFTKILPVFSQGQFTLTQYLPENVRGIVKTLSTNVFHMYFTRWWAFPVALTNLKLWTNIFFTLIDNLHG